MSVSPVIKGIHFPKKTLLECSKYIKGTKCLICGTEQGSTFETLKHVKTHHLNVICETIENKQVEKSDVNHKLVNIATNDNFCQSTESNSNEDDLKLKVS